MSWKTVARIVFYYFKKLMCMKTKLYSLLQNLCLFFLLIAFSQTTKSQTYSIFPSSAAPSLQNENDGPAIETGVRFRVTQYGMINAIRFYRSPSDMSTNHATLWTHDGDTLSSSGTVTLETGGGWKTIALPEPVAVVPGNIYVASVFIKSGFYVAEPFSFCCNDLGSSMVFGLAYDSTAENGIYHSGGAGFPSTSYHASNYFVDVVFTPASELPIDLMELVEVNNEFDADLSWKTANESGIEGFEVQRSSNGWLFNTLSFIDAEGESTTVSDYSYRDLNLNPGLYTYRLKIKAANGNFQYSALTTCTIDPGKGLVVFPNYPNPVVGTTTIHYVVPEQSQVKLSLIDMNGRVVRVLVNGERNAGHHYVTLDAGPLNRGVYFYTLQSGSHKAATGRLLVQ
jgi:hypothetical protein